MLHHSKCHIIVGLPQTLIESPNFTQILKYFADEIIPIPHSITLDFIKYYQIDKILAFKSSDERYRLALEMEILTFVSSNHLPNFKKRSFLRTFIMHVLTIYLMGVTNIYVYKASFKKGKSINCQPTLPDLLFKLLPHIPKAQYLPDFAIYSTFFMAMYCILSHPNRKQLICLLETIHMVLFWMRITTVSSTILPSPLPICKTNEIEKIYTQNCFIVPIKLLLEGRGLNRMGCNDLVFGGHVMFYGVMNMFIWEDFRRPLWFKLMAMLFAMMGFIGTILSRDHYTLDNLVAIYFCICFYLIYKREIKARYLQSI